MLRYKKDIKTIIWFLIISFLFIRPAFAIDKDLDPFLSKISSVSDKVLLEKNKNEKILRDERGKLENLSLDENKFFLPINTAQSLLLTTGEDLSLFEKSLKNLKVLKISIESEVELINKKNLKFNNKKKDMADKIILIDEKINSGKNIDDNTIESLEGYKSLFLKNLNTIKLINQVLLKQKDVFNNALERLNLVKKRIGKHIEDKEEKALFKRNERAFYQIGFNEISIEIKKISSSFIEFFHSGEYRTFFIRIKKSFDFFNLISFLGLFFVFFILKKAFNRFSKIESFTKFYFSRKGYLLNLIVGSVNYIVLIIFINFISSTNLYTVFPSFFNFIKDFLFILFFTKIASDTIIVISKDSFIQFSSFLLGWKRFFILGVRLYSFIYFFMYWFFGQMVFLINPLRIVFELFFTMGGLIFWRHYEKKIGLIDTTFLGLKYLSFFILFFGFGADISGFRTLASYWYISWGLTFVVVCVSFVFFYSLDEIDNSFSRSFEPESKKSHGVSYPIYWLTSRWIYLVAGFFAIAGIAWAWGGFEEFFSGVLYIFDKKYKISGLSLSFSAFFYFVVFLIFIHFFVKAWKRLMLTKILKGSGLTQGVKESVTTISVYFIWSLGILFSFNIIGLNTTSIAVGLGALGVGLGFGLQNIFNNFISGLILLFERPVQVGDVVEISGLFGVVEKINVRSTIVQTYDNSSIIIPNSELISSRVTNWSHKDPYIRRDLFVGVAYGSDTESVKTLLLNAAEKVREIGVYPAKPEVHFLDFGSSSLDFRLRFWSNLDFFLLAESNLRFEIEKVFKENDIIIPFPQRDVHIIKENVKALNKEDA